jgi:hypothetical protein
VAFAGLIVLLALARGRHTPADPGAQRGFGRRYWLVVAGQVAAIPAGAALLNGPAGLSHAVVAWVSVVVGAHFLVLAAIWRLRLFRLLGAAIALCGVAGLGRCGHRLPAGGDRRSRRPARSAAARRWLCRSSRHYQAAGGRDLPGQPAQVAVAEYPADHGDRPGGGRDSSTCGRLREERRSPATGLVLAGYPSYRMFVAMPVGQATNHPGRLTAVTGTCQTVEPVFGQTNACALHCGSVPSWFLE